MNEIKVFGQSILVQSETTVSLVGLNGPLNTTFDNVFMLTAPQIVHPSTKLLINNSYRVPLIPYCPITLKEPPKQLDIILPQSMVNVSGITEINIRNIEFVSWTSCDENFETLLVPRSAIGYHRFSLSSSPSFRLLKWALKELVIKAYGTSTFQFDATVRSYDSNQGIDNGEEYHLTHSRSSLGGNETLEIKSPVNTLNFVTSQSNGTPGSSHYIELVMIR